MSADWIPFFTAVAGAAAALAGLIIVSIATSVDRMVAIPAMTSRAGAGIALLVAVTLVALAGLVPEQSVTLFGVEALVVSLGALAFAVDSLVRLVRARDENAAAREPWLKAGISVVPALALTVGSVLVLSGHPAGLALIVSGVLLSFVSSVVNAWVVLVEIRR